MNLAKLNHILIPPTKDGRDRFRRGLVGRLLRPFSWVYGALTEEGRVIAAASFVVGAFGLEVRSTDAHLLWAALAGLLAGSLLVRRLFRLESVVVEVAAPRRVTVGEPMKFAVVLQNRGPRDAYALRVRGPFLPWDGRWIGGAGGVQRLAAGGGARVEIAARFIERGEHHLDPFGAAALVPLGLAASDPVYSAGCRFLVIPKIAPVLRVTTPMARRYQPGGVPLASKAGESMELLGVRPYRPGDPVRHLHARSWARAGAPVVREYHEEYFSRVGVVVDTRGAEPRRLEAIVSLAAGVVACLGRGEALIDLLVVGGQVHELTIGRHLGFLEQALDLLACVRAGDERADPDRLVARLAEHLPRLSCMIVVAASWDDGALAERFRGFGVGTTTLLVTRDATRHGTPGPDVRVIEAGVIERGEALSL